MLVLLLFLKYEVGERILIRKSSSRSLSGQKKQLYILHSAAHSLPGLRE